jgi:hypothetical protein
MMFCETIHQILRTRAPIQIKLALLHSVFDPIKVHIHGVCVFLFYCAIAVSCGSGIVRFHWCGGRLKLKEIDRRAPPGVEHVA